VIKELICWISLWVDCRCIWPSAYE